MGAGSDSESFDSAPPLTGVVLCCTSIPPDQRTEIANCTTEMGGIHKYDLTPDVTHLIVGEYDTPKYRHVAKERPDIVPMAPGWIRAMRHYFMGDQDIDFNTLQEEWRLKTFETGGSVPQHSDQPETNDRRRLLCCLTGFEDSDTRAEIEEKVVAHGGQYTGDLSRKVTHLIVHKPEGRKYVAAKNWGLQTVSIEWLNDSVERGMILDETCYDPVLPVEERGRGAWIRRRVKRDSLGKRPRDGTAAGGGEGRRKLRKTASMKLNTQRANIWGDILVKRSSTDLSKMAPPIEQETESVPVVGQSGNTTSKTPEVPEDSMTQPTQASGPVFSSCRFFVHGFDSRRTAIVCNHLESHGAQISSSLEDVASPNHLEELGQRFVVVPQASSPESHPRSPEGLNIVTEFYIERCMHNRYLFHPNEHVLGRPFPRFPIDGLQNLTICTAGFKNEQLNQVEKALIQLGAKYSERLNAQTSLLVCPSVGNVRKQKLDFAVTAKVPVISANWLWRCIETGRYASWHDFLCKELKQQSFEEDSMATYTTKESLQLPTPETMPKKAKPEFRGPPPKAGVDRTAFDDDMPGRPPPIERQETHESHYETAPTHQDESAATRLSAAPLGEVSQNALNRSPSPQKSAGAAPIDRKLKRFPTGGTIGDSTADEDDSDTSAINRPKTASSNDKQPRQHARTEPEERGADSLAESRKKEKEKSDKISREKQEMSERLNLLMADHEEAKSTSADDESARVRAPPRRKREILGRAQSNVSATSTGSGESSAVVSAAAVPDGINGNASGNGPDSEPPATQLQYDNPDARNHRAQVMKRVFGAAGAAGDVDKPRVNDSGRGPSSSSIGFYSFAGAGGSERRTRNRREKGF